MHFFFIHRYFDTSVIFFTSIDLHTFSHPRVSLFSSSTPSAPTLFHIFPFPFSLEGFRRYLCKLIFNLILFCHSPPLSSCVFVFCCLLFSFSFFFFFSFRKT